MSDRLDDLFLPNSDGESVRLGDLWAERPVALVFLRHYGCMFCIEQTAQLQEAAARGETGDGEIVLIGLGTPAEAAEFKRLQKVDFPVLADKAAQSYKLAGVKRGSVAEVMGPKNWIPGIKATLGGHRQRRAKQDAMQLGGALVIAPGGEVTWRWAAETSHEIADTQEIAEQLKAQADRAAAAPA